MKQRKTTLDEDIKLLADVNKDVWLEIERQREKYGVQRYSQGEWLPILVEEVGEAAQAMQKDSVAYKATDADSEYEEVIQVAAVAMSWAAQLLEEKRKGAALNAKKNPDTESHQKGQGV